MNHLRSSSLTLLAALLAQGAHAKESTVDADPFFQEMPIVLTASRLSQPISEAPSAMTVIDKNMIKASGFRSVPELMRLVPGMYVGYADANRPVVSFHGSEDELARRMQILVDGRSIYMPPHGGVSWADLPLLIEDIERIEVVRGPSSASHGTNSFYGVINIITKDALSQNGSSVSVTKGAGTSDASARLGSIGETYDYRLAVGYRSDQGIDNVVLNDHNITNVFNFRSNYHPDASNSLDVQLGSSNGVYGLGILDVPKQNTAGYVGLSRPEDPFRDTKTNSDFLQLTWLHVLSGGDESKLTYSHSAYDYFDPNICIQKNTCQNRTTAGKLIVGGFAKSVVKSERNEIELQNTTQLGNANRFVWGGGARRDYAEYALLLEIPHTITAWQLFAHDEWRIGEATVFNVGTMFEHDGMGNQNNSPRASLNYHFAPDHTVRFGVSTATRSPVMSEAFISANNTVWGGSYKPPINSLKPEKVLSKEVGYLGDFRSIGVSMDVRAYIEQVSDLIWWDKFVQVTPDGGDYYDSWGNVLSAEYKGVDATVKYHWDEGHSFAVLAYAYQQASAAIGTAPTQYNSTATEIWGDYPTIGDLTRTFYRTEYLSSFHQTVPKHSASLLLSQNLADSWQVSAGYYYRELVRVADVSPPTSTHTPVTPETIMRRVDLRVAKTFKSTKGQSSEVALVIQNATRDDYTKYGTIDQVSQVQFSRRGWITATFNF
ncbi:MAG: TonB-dependent receptor [Gallionellaceae bacterium]|nr:TonB-dependent receptor [Gallionellaceae bacterium]